jgi:hypothetical protein
MTRRLLLTAIPSLLPAQQEPAEAEPEFLCPMDKDVRSKGPGKCPRCGMALVAGLPDPVEYPVELRVTPRRLQPGQPFDLRFRVLHPASRKPVSKLVEMHEKLFHLFLISQDLNYFAHEHPDPQPDGSLTFRTALPRPGVYRLVCDFYPEGGTPQMVPKTLIIPGSRPPVTPLRADLAPRQVEGVEFRLTTEPAEPLAGKKTLLFFEFVGLKKLEPYLSSWAHLMVASADLIDLVHLHPVIAEGGPKMQFNVIFPRAGVHRVWVQIQDAGRVLTGSFDVPVKVLS